MKEAEKLVYESILLKKCGMYLKNSSEEKNVNTTSQIRKPVPEISNMVKLSCGKLNKKEEVERKSGAEINCRKEISRTLSPSLCGVASPEVLIVKSFIEQRTSSEVEFIKEIRKKRGKKCLSTCLEKQSLKNNIPNESTIRSVEKQKVWECPICLEPSRGQEIVTTVCGHVFCKGCLESYASFKADKIHCPTCRFDLTKTKFVTLYNF
ncbi:hypothetical protein RUM44_011740 [Polyplax serrata]|uniref:RING-type domain-containing protein n=1 Tax=Polyplax serrata TaxID=468196 RepID=A0ABR1AQW1_POLSC